MPPPSPSGDRERVRTGNTPRERFHPRSPPPEPELIQLPMSDGDDDHHMMEDNLPLLQNLMMYQMRILRLLIPHHHQLDHHHQLNREVAQEETRDLDLVSEHLHMCHHMRARSHNRLCLLLELSRSSL